MDRSLLKGEQQGNDNDDFDGDEDRTNQDKEVYYSSMLDSESSEEEVEEEGEDESSAEVKIQEADNEEEEGEVGDQYTLLGDSLDDDFDEFQTSEAFQPEISVGGSFEAPLASLAPVDSSGVGTAVESNSVRKDEKNEVTDLQPAQRIAPLTADHVYRIKKAMEGVKITPRDGPIASLVQKLEGARVGDEQHDKN